VDDSNMQCQTDCHCDHSLDTFVHGLRCGHSNSVPWQAGATATNFAELLFKCIRNHLLLKSKLAVWGDWIGSKRCLCAALHLGSIQSDHAETTQCKSNKDLL
jgi:hypothetical protein